MQRNTILIVVGISALLMLLIATGIGGAVTIALLVNRNSGSSDKNEGGDDASEDTIENLDTTTTVVGDVLEKQVMNEETGEVETQTIDLEAGDMPEKGADMGPSREELGAQSSMAMLRIKSL